MARIRTIKPDMWDDEAFGQLSLEAQLLFVGLITQADDEGRQKTTAHRLGARLWPYKPDVNAVRVGEWLEELTKAFLVVRYEVERRNYLWLPTWLKHQRISRPTQSLHPIPPTATTDQITVSMSPPKNSGALRKIPARSVLNRNRKGNRNGKRISPLTPQGGNAFYNGKRVPEGRLTLAMEVLDNFNRLASQKYRPHTADGKITADLRVIVGFLTSFPEYDLMGCAKLITATLEEPWWKKGEPVSPGMVFGPRVAQKNIARASGSITNRQLTESERQYGEYQQRAKERWEQRTGEGASDDH